MHAQRLFFAFLFLITTGINAQWVNQPIPNSTASIRCAYFKSTSEGYVGGAERIRRTVNGGINWDTASYGIASYYLGSGIVESIYFANANEGIASGWNFWDNCAIVFKTYDGGITWNSIRYQGLIGTTIHDMAFASSTEGFCVGKNGSILHSTNEGDSWSPINSGTTNELFGVYFVGSTGWIVGDEVILKTTNMGTSWSPQSFPGEFFKNVHFVNATDGYAIGNHIYKTINGGNSWVLLNGSPAGEDIFATHSDTLFAAGTSGLYKSVDGGLTWYPQFTLPSKNYLGVWFMNSTFGYTTASDGTIYKTTSGGDPIPQNDAGVSYIEPVPSGSCIGVYPINVKIKNYGQAPLTQAVIEWKIDNVSQVAYTWTGNLPHDSVSGVVTIGTFNFPRGNHSIEAYTTYANSQLEVVHGNDGTSSSFNFPQMTGTYTVGGLTPDYAYLDDAIDALNNYGICGSVEFKIRDGVHFSMFLSSIQMNSPDDSIIFRSESGDSSQVIISGFPYALMLSDVNNIKFSGMTFEGLGYDYIVALIDNMNNITFENCVFSGDNADAMIFHSGFPCNNLKLIDCRFREGSTAVELSSTLFNDGLIISGCIMDTIENGLNISRTKNIIIKDNVISNPNCKPGNLIHISECNDGFLIAGNRVTSNCARNLLDIDNCMDSTNAGSIIRNNFFSSNQLNNNVTAIRLTGLSIQFIHNTVNANHEAAVYLDLDDTTSDYRFTFIDNIICNRNHNLVFDASLPDDVLERSYTNCFASIGHNAYYNLPGFGVYSVYLDMFYSNGNFKDWQGLFPGDTTSIIANPQIMSYTDPHIYPNNSNIIFNNAGIFVPGNEFDIDGNPRGQFPDPGCSEFDLFSLDAGVKNILQQTRICAGVNSVDMCIGNYGLTTLTSATVNWTVNNVPQPQFTWTGSLSSGDTTAWISVGSYNFILGSTYTIKLWVTDPNAATDVNAINDTCTVALLTKGRSGLYTIGGTLPDYVNLVAAVQDLDTAGLCGPVVFDIRPGTYSGKVNINQIPGISVVNNITFQSENHDSTSVIISEVNDTVIVLNAAGFITFYQLTIWDSSTQITTHCCIYLKHQNFVRDVNFRNCVFKCYGRSIVIDKDLYGVINLLFDKNRIEGGIKLNTSAPFDENMIFSNNEFLDLGTSNIYISGCHNLLLDNNIFSGQMSASPLIDIDADARVIVTRNKIVCSGNRAIRYIGEGLPFSKSIFANNMVSMTGGSQKVYDLSNAMNVLFVNNSGYVVNAPNSVTVLDAPLGNSIIENNSLYNAASGYAVLLTPSIDVKSDFNNYFADSVPPVNGSYTLNQWQSAFGTDMHSVSGDPQYISYSDLHSSGSYFLNAGANPLTAASTDIDGEIRTAFPDIGADEFVADDSLTWPGDCNYDGVANNYDLLSIGSYFNQAGIARASVSNAWVGQLSSDWGSLQYCGFDKKHADCDGDGIVSWSDTTAIRQNWGQAPHPYRFGHVPHVSSLPDLFFVINDTILNPGDTVDVEIHLGDAGTPIDSIHGIAFDIAYTSNMILAGSMSLSFPPSFLGIENLSTITISNITSVASGAVTRILPTDTSGYGIIAMLHFIIDPQAITTGDLVLSFTNYMALTAGGTSLSFNAVSDSVFVFTYVGVNSPSDKYFLEVFPNPAVNSTQVIYNLEEKSQVHISLMNCMGQMVAVLKKGNENAGFHSIPLEPDREKIPSGIYFLKLNVNGSELVRRLVLQ